MFNLLINKSDLRAALNLAGNKDIRYYLNGVLVEVGARESRIVATDGTVLCVIKGEAPEEFTFDGVQSVIIPRDVIAKIKKPARHDGTRIYLSFDGEKGTLTDRGASETFTPIDGMFPNWRKVLPSELSGVPSQFDPALIAKFAKAANEFGHSILHIHHNGNAEHPDSGGAAVVSIGSDDRFIGVVMPYRTGGGCEANPVPEWVRHAVDFVPAEPETAEA